MDSLVCRLVNLSELSYTEDAVDGAFSFRVKSNEFFVPLSDNIDVGAELEKLHTELDYTHGFLKSVEGKLSNERFVNNAPEQVVAIERKKQSPETKNRLMHLQNVKPLVLLLTMALFQRIKKCFVNLDEMRFFRIPKNRKIQSLSCNIS